MLFALEAGSVSDQDLEQLPLREHLQLVRNLRIGLAVGIATALLAYVVRIGALLGPVRDTRGGPLLFAILAFVLAVSMTALVAGLLTVHSALRWVSDTE